MVALADNRTYGFDDVSAITGLNPAFPSIGDFNSMSQFHGLVIEFDIDPATIDLNLTVNLDLSVIENYSTSEAFYIRRWDSAFPTTGSELVESNQTSQIFMDGSKIFDISTLVSQAVTANDTKLMFWLGIDLFSNGEFMRLHDNGYVNHAVYYLGHTPTNPPVESTISNKKLFDNNLFPTNLLS